MVNKFIAIQITCAYGVTAITAIVEFCAYNTHHINRHFWLYLQEYKQGLHRHQTPPRYRNAASGRHASPCGPLWTNVTSSIKPEVQNIAQRHQWTTKPRPQGICTKIFNEDRSSGFRDMLVDKQTYRQTNSSQYSAPLLGRSN